MLRKELQASSKDLAHASEEVIYKIDIPANRYDMLCLEGIAQALNVFRGRVPPPAYRLADMAGNQELVSRHPHACSSSSLQLTSFPKPSFCAVRQGTPAHCDQARDCARQALCGWGGAPRDQL